MKPGGINHPKVEELGDVLGIRLREARGIIEALIHFTNQYAERGDVGRFTDAQIAKRLDWGGKGEDPERLIAGLLSTKWLEPHGAHRFVLHDWPDHAPDYTKRKVKGAAERPGPGWAEDDPEPPDFTADSTPSGDSRQSQTIPDPLSSPNLSEPLLSEPIVAPGGALCLCPETLTDDDLGKLRRWAVENAFTPDQVEAAFQRVHDWSHTSSKKRARWWLVTKNAMQDGWALRGGGDKPPKSWAQQQEDETLNWLRSVSNEQRTDDAGSLGSGTGPPVRRISERRD